VSKTIAIIGGGPAGLSCALWLKYLGFTPIIMERKHQLGGSQRLSHFNNVWYLGMIKKTGRQFAEQFAQHVEAEKLETLFGLEIQHIAKAGDDFKIIFNGQERVVQGLLIATGQRPKGCEWIESIAGAELLRSSANVCFDPGATPLLVLDSRIEGQIVAVVGGGDNGLVTAMLLANKAKQVHLFVRGPMLGFAVNQTAVHELILAGKIILHQPANILGFEAEGETNGVAFSDQHSPSDQLAFGQICFRLGFTPNVETIAALLETGRLGKLQLSDKGYIATDIFLRTSLPHVYAAGDVVNPRDPCVATAVAHGAIAARSIEEDFRSRWGREVARAGFE
jgi:thioredoxin reductase